MCVPLTLSHIDKLDHHHLVRVKSVICVHIYPLSYHPLQFYLIDFIYLHLVGHTRELSRLKMRISSAPTLTSSSIVSAILDRSTIALTATHSGSSSGIIDGARRPGVTAVALESIARGILYWHTIYLPAAMTPAIRAVILSTSGARCACFDFVERISTASDCSSVAMGRRPAARIVSPDSVHTSVVSAGGGGGE